MEFSDFFLGNFDGERFGRSMEVRSHLDRDSECSESVRGKGERGRREEIPEIGGDSHYS